MIVFINTENSLFNKKQVKSDLQITYVAKGGFHIEDEYYIGLIEKGVFCRSVSNGYAAMPALLPTKIDTLIIDINSNNRLTKTQRNLIELLVPIAKKIIVLKQQLMTKAALGTDLLFFENGLFKTHTNLHYLVYYTFVTDIVYAIGAIKQAMRCKFPNQYLVFTDFERYVSNINNQVVPTNYNGIDYCLATNKAATSFFTKHISTQCDLSVLLHVINPIKIEYKHQLYITMSINEATSYRLSVTTNKTYNKIIAAIKDYLSSINPSRLKK